MKTPATIAALSALALASAATAQYAITSHTIDAAGGTLTGATYSVTGTAGQPDAEGARIGATYKLASGFWPSTTTCACAGDMDADCDTDVFDFGIFAPKFGTTGHPPCTNGDLDGDGDVDVFDFGIFAPDFGCSE